MIAEMFLIVNVISKLTDLYRKLTNCTSWTSVCYVTNTLIWCNTCTAILTTRLANRWKKIVYYLIELRKGLLTSKLSKHLYHGTYFIPTTGCVVRTRTLDRELNKRYTALTVT